MIRYQASPASAPTTPPPAPPCGRSLVERMAGDMREMAFAGQNVSLETLIERGWTRATVERFAPQAVARARRQSVRRVA